MLINTVLRHDDIKDQTAESKERETMKNSASNSVFTQVDYRQFRQHLADITTNTVKGKGYETAIYDSKGDIQAIVHAASIDTNGHCYPAEYFIRSSALPAASELEWLYAA
ncbi:hypothetical protein [Oceanicoccus sagamiensis]|uniref:Uncharacterized protein n=1 Tax=Oceanicoccus sagamiensis TaxID=716816 RepID=A0A1X9NBE3_9GAMM|nr:hypothetical protein [Oceanicoccus sagamiensis]ARN74926.1 hypothetical protein BST96_12865 [Oceanicoccus sagamiensis]